MFETRMLSKSSFQKTKERNAGTTMVEENMQEIEAGNFGRDITSEKKLKQF